MGALELELEITLEDELSMACELTVATELELTELLEGISLLDDITAWVLALLSVVAPLQAQSNRVPAAIILCGNVEAIVRAMRVFKPVEKYIS